METTTTCPGCGSEDVLPIVYGMPGPSLTEESLAGRVALGGCVLFPDAPDRLIRSNSPGPHQHAQPRQNTIPRDMSILTSGVPGPIGPARCGYSRTSWKSNSAEVRMQHPG